MSEIYTFTAIISLATFILTTHITPGPTNVILLSSVITFGYKKTLPFMIANVISYMTMVIFVGLGVGIFLMEYQTIANILKVVGLVYICWMAYKIANATSAPDSKDLVQSKPFTFWQSFIYPWLNPKAWIVYSSMISIFVTSSQKSFEQMSVIVLFIFIALLINTYLWAMGGVVLKRFLKDIKTLKRFNQGMAILLVVSILPILIK